MPFPLKTEDVKSSFIKIFTKPSSTFKERDRVIKTQNTIIKVQNSLFIRVLYEGLKPGVDFFFSSDLAGYILVHA
jgi:hypothetical protein